MNNNTKSSLNNQEENQNFELTSSSKNEYGFTIVPPAGFKVMTENIDSESGYLLISLWNFDKQSGLNYLFDQEKNHITWEQRAEELKDYIEEKNIDNEYKVERRKIVDIERGIELFDDKLYKNGIQVSSSSYTTMSGNYPIDSVFHKYLEGLANKSEFEKKRSEYNLLPLSEKVKHWKTLIIQAIYQSSGNYKVDVSAIRKNSEKNIDLFLNSIINGIADLNNISYDEVIKDFIILDDVAKKHIKTSEIEGIDISFEDLTEKIGNLFYDSLSSLLNTLAENIENNSKKEAQLGNNESEKKLLEISEKIKGSSINIMNAWEICKPYISEDFPAMKHTAELKGIDKFELSEKIGNLQDKKLKELLQLLSEKIKKDGEADKGRGRNKLANELFTCAQQLLKAQQLIKIEE